MQVYEIALSIEDNRWNKIPDLQNLCERAVSAAVKNIDLRPFAELSIAFIDDTHMQNLNKKYRQKDKPTNVLSFPATPIDGFAPLLGDIVLAYDTLETEAETANISLEDHLTHLVMHGFYHLQGYDHQNDQDAKIMEALEIKALSHLDIANPYARERSL